MRVYDRRERKQRWLGTRSTRREADRLEAEWLLRESEPSHLPFRAFAQEWLGTINVRPRTDRDYQTTTAHLCEYFREGKLKDITPKDVDAFVRWSSDRYAPVTTRKQVTRLRQMMRKAVEWGYLDRSPAGGKLSLPPVNRKQVTPLSPEQANALIEAAESYYRPVFLTALTTGLRQSELFGLRWEDVDLDGGTLTVRQTMYEGKLEGPKSSAGRRTLFLPERTVDAIRAHREVCPVTEHNLVFPAPWGRYMATKTWSESVMIPTAKRAKLPDYRLHDLRHCYASLLIRSGCSAKLVQTLMGHSTITVTMDVYGHLFPDEAEQAAQRVAEFIG